MKQAKTILFSALVTLLAFGSITYTSCTKNNKCSGVVCLNGGACNGSSCLCPTGYTGSDCGTVITSSITYTNNTFTPVTIIANGASSIISVGGSVTYNGLYGNPLNVTAKTYGTGPSGTTQVGLAINWDLSEVFPEGGSATYGIDVDSTFIFIKVQDENLTYSGKDIFVNYGNPHESYDVISIPNDAIVHNVGYYKVYNNTEIYIDQANPGTSFWEISPFTTTTFTKNQSYTYTFN